MIGDVRGQGQMIGFELSDPETGSPFDLSLNVGSRISDYCKNNGVILRNLADTFIISPPFILEKAHVDVMVETFETALVVVARTLG